MAKVLHSPKYLYKDDRPREKLEKRGVDTLSDFELLQVLIGSGVKGHHVGEVALNVQEVLLQKGLDTSFEELLEIKGLSRAKVATFLAAVEISNRFRRELQRIETANDVLPYVREFQERAQEHLLLLSLNGAGQLISKKVITVGTLNKTLIHPREVFAEAIADRAASIILAHNHPSGNPSPSDDDQHVTEVIAEAGRLMGIRLEDHIIFTSGYEYYSFREEGEL